MAGDYVDEYIATFEVSARCANVKLDNPANIRMFVQGLPRGLAERCIDIKSSNTFVQWARTVTVRPPCRVEVVSRASRRSFDWASIIRGSNLIRLGVLA